MISRPFRALFVTELLTSLNLNAFVVKKKRLKTWLAAVALIVGLMPAYAMLAATEVIAFRYLNRHGLPLQDVVLTGLYAAAQLVLLLAAIPIVYSALYQSNELSILLPLPYPPWQILAAKLGAIYVPEMLLGWAFFVPGLAAYYAYGYGSLAALPVTLMGLLFMPVIPVCISTVLCVLIASTPGIGRSRWFWYTSITLGLMAAFMLPSIVLSAQDPSSVRDLVQVRMRQMGQLGRLMPGVQFAMYALTEEFWKAALHQLLHVAIAGGYLMATLAVGDRLFIGPVLRGAAAAKRRSARVARTRVRSYLASAVEKEIVCTLKDPAVAMNGLGGYIALPILAVVYSILKYQTRGKVDVLGQMDQFLHGPAFARYLPFMVTGMALGLAAFGSMSSLFAAAYSKDGKRLWIEKSLPVAPFTVFLGKFLAAFFLDSVLNLITVAVFVLVVPFRAEQWLYTILLSEIVIGWSGAAALAVDCVRPKLVWKDTLEAVKQNVNVVIGLAVGILGLGLNLLALRALYVSSAQPAVTYALVMALNVAFLAAAFVAGKAAAARFPRVTV